MHYLLPGTSIQFINSYITQIIDKIPFQSNHGEMLFSRNPLRTTLAQGLPWNIQNSLYLSRLIVIDLLRVINQCLICLTPVIPGPLIVLLLDNLPGCLPLQSYHNVEYHKQHQRQPDQPSQHRTDYYHYCLTHLSSLSIHQEHYQAQQSHANTQDYRDQKPQEVPIVALPHTVIHEGAVMVEHLHTVLTHTAMTGSRGSEYQAALTESPLVVSIGVSHVRHQVNLKLLPLLLQKGLARDYPWICEPCEQEECQREENADSGAYRECWGNLCPERSCEEDVIGDHDSYSADVVAEVGCPIAGRACDAFAFTAESVSSRPQLIDFPDHVIIMKVQQRISYWKNNSETSEFCQSK